MKTSIKKAGKLPSNMKAKVLSKKAEVKSNKKK